MKKIFTSFSVFVALLACNVSFGQSFNIASDTAILNLNTADHVYDNVTNTTSAAITIEWKVIATDFPADWIAAAGICDNCTCISGTGIWPPTASTKHECDYPITPSITNDFKLQVPLGTGGSTGTYYLKARLNNKFTPADTAIATFIVSRTPTSVSTVKVVNDVSIYPNPATNALNVVYDAGADIRNIAIYNIIGKQMNMFRVTGNSSASLNLENIPTGIYFVRLLNSRGDVVTTRKFTKQ